MAESHDPASRPADKHVDESWKDAVEKEKHVLSEENHAQNFLPEASFAFFISSLGMQALAALGEVEHPATGEKKIELRQARYLIDTLQMLSDKTHGNLSKEESQTLEGILHTLRLKFVEKKQAAQ